MDNFKKYIYGIGLAFLLLSSASVLPFYRLIFGCIESWYLWVFIGYSFIIFPLALYRLLKLFKIDYSALFWTGVFSLAFYILAYHMSNRIALEEIRNSGGIVKIATIIEKYSSIQSAESISIMYSSEKEEIEAKYQIPKDVYNNLEVGDTILIVYSVKCSKWNLPYDLMPTLSERQKYKHGIRVAGDNNSLEESSNRK